MAISCVELSVTIEVTVVLSQGILNFRPKGGFRPQEVHASPYAFGPRPQHFDLVTQQFGFRPHGFHSCPYTFGTQKHTEVGPVSPQSGTSVPRSLDFALKRVT